MLMKLGSDSVGRPISRKLDFYVRQELAVVDAAPSRAAFPTPSNRDSLSARLRGECLDVGFGYLRRRRRVTDLHAEHLLGLGHPGRAHDVDSQAARELERGAAREALERGVDGADRSGARHRLLGEHTRGEDERAAVAHVVDAEAHEVHLAHELVSQGVREVVVAKLGKGLETRVARGADDGVDLANGSVERADRGGIAEVDLVPRFCLARGDDFVVRGKRTGNGTTDRSRRADEQNAHEDLRVNVSMCRRVQSNLFYRSLRFFPPVFRDGGQIPIVESVVRLSLATAPAR